MANPENLKILKRGVKSWNKWVQIKKNDPQIGLQFSAHEGTKASAIGFWADLTGADLRGAELSQLTDIIGEIEGRPVRGVEEEGHDLRGADLRGANLNGASLTYADLTGANLYKAELKGADLIFTNCRGANLGGANLSKTFLGQTNFFQTNLMSQTLPIFRELSAVSTPGCQSYYSP